MSRAPVRQTATPPEGTVLFMVGMRINKLRAIHRWLPVTFAMPRMLIEQMKHREIGMIGTPRTFVSGRVVMVVQYWESAEKLEAYAKDALHSHLPAWRDFNAKARKSDSVGVFHETYIIGTHNHENISVQLPNPILLGAAVGVSPVNAARDTARQRLKD